MRVAVAGASPLALLLVAAALVTPVGGQYWTERKVLRPNCHADANLDDVGERSGLTYICSEGKEKDAHEKIVIRADIESYEDLGNNEVHIVNGVSPPCYETAHAKRLTNERARSIVVRQLRRQRHILERAALEDSDGDHSDSEDEYGSSLDVITELYADIRSRINDLSNFELRVRPVSEYTMEADYVLRSLESSFLMSVARTAEDMGEEEEQEEFERMGCHPFQEEVTNLNAIQRCMEHSISKYQKQKKEALEMNPCPKSKGELYDKTGTPPRLSCPNYRLAILSKYVNQCHSRPTECSTLGELYEILLAKMKKDNKHFKNYGVLARMRECTRRGDLPVSDTTLERIAEAYAVSYVYSKAGQKELLDCIFSNPLIDRPESAVEALTCSQSMYSVSGFSGFVVEENEEPGCEFVGRVYPGLDPVCSRLALDVLRKPFSEKRYAQTKGFLSHMSRKVEKAFQFGNRAFMPKACTDRSPGICWLYSRCFDAALRTLVYDNNHPCSYYRRTMNKKELREVPKSLKKAP